MELLCGESGVSVGVGGGAGDVKSGAGARRVK